MEAPREMVFNEAFNVGTTSENYQIRELAASFAPTSTLGLNLKK